MTASPRARARRRPTLEQVLGAADADDASTSVIPMGAKRFRYSLSKDARQKKVTERIEALENQRWDTEITLAGLKAQVTVMRDDDASKPRVEEQIKTMGESIEQLDVAITAIEDLPVR